MVWSWSQSEALLCDYTQFLGAFGGQFLDGNGKPSFNRGPGVQALTFMKQTLDLGLTDPNSLTMLDENVTSVFEKGGAAFTLNWTYLYNDANARDGGPFAGQFDILQTPEGVAGHRPGVNGNMALSITAGSRKQKAAWKYLQYLSSAGLQNMYAKNALPVWKSSYTDPLVVKTGPAVVAAARKELDEQITRPTLPKYSQVSQLIYEQLHRALTGAVPIQKALDDAAAAVEA
jgi:multiple sugar transport system substrate-binding protein